MIRLRELLLAAYAPLARRHTLVDPLPPVPTLRRSKRRAAGAEPAPACRLIVPRR